MERLNFKRKTRKPPIACRQEGVRSPCLKGYFGPSVPCLPFGVCSLQPSTAPRAMERVKMRGTVHFYPYCISHSQRGISPFPGNCSIVARIQKKKINTKLYHKSEHWIPSRIRVNSIWLLGNYGLLSEHSFDLSSNLVWFRLVSKSFKKQFS